MARSGFSFLCPRKSPESTVYFLILIAPLCANNRIYAGWQTPNPVTDGLGGFRLVENADQIKKDATNSLAVDPNTNWVKAGQVVDFAGTVRSDRVTISGNVIHVNGPGAQPGLGTQWTFDFGTVNAGDQGVGNNKTKTIDIQATVNGKSFDFKDQNGKKLGTDTYVAALTVTVKGGLNLDDITAYNLSLQGDFTPVGQRAQALTSGLDGTQVVSGSASSASGVSTAFFNISTNTLDLSIGASGIILSDLIDAQIHQGAPGQVGPTILDLGGQSSWVASGAGIAFSGQVDFPSQYVSDLLSGNTYIELDTLSFPNGDIRGQLVPYSPNVVPEPSTFVLLMTGTISLLVLNRKRNGTAS
jgi:hypothetical protein